MATKVTNRARSASTMQAMVQSAYGGPDRLRLSEVEAPTLAPGSVLVRTRASSVNMADRLSMRGMPYIMRVVGGAYRGRPLATPRSQAIRPTTDRAREALRQFPAAQVPLHLRNAVTPLMAETTTTTSFPARRVATM